MTLSDAISSVVQVLTGMVVLVTLFGALAALTRGERLRRRLKTHTEVLAALPDGEDAIRMRQIVSDEVQQLHRITFPATQTCWPWSRLVAALAVLAGGVGVVLLLMTGFDLDDPLYWPSVLSLLFAGALFQVATHQRDRARKAPPPTSP